MAAETKTTHTPGPWRAAVEDDDDQRAGEFELACLEHPIWGTNIYAPGGYSDDYTEHVANARLIAAAPDLLAACRRAEAAAWFVATSGNPDAVAIHAEIRAAITKAEGQ